MSEDRIERMTSRERLILSPRRWLIHYCMPILLIISSISVIIAFIEGRSSGFYKVEKDLNYYIVIFMVFILFPFLAILTSIVQYRALKFITIPAILSAKNNQNAALQALRRMHWTIKVNQEGFMEAHNPILEPTSLRTFGREMITVIILEKRVLLNCICNVDTTIWFQGAFTFGKIKELTEKFKKYFASEVTKLAGNKVH